MLIGFIDRDGSNLVTLRSLEWYIIGEKLRTKKDWKYAFTKISGSGELRNLKLGFLEKAVICLFLINLM